MHAAVAALGLSTGCGYMDDEDCFEKAEEVVSLRDLPGTGVARMVCLDSPTTQIRGRNDGCVPFERNGSNWKFAFDFGELKRDNPNDYRLVFSYKCSEAAKINSGSDFDEIMSGSDLRVADVHLDTIGCTGGDIEIEMYMADYYRSTSECNSPVGAWEVTVSGDSVLVEETDEAGGNDFRF